MEHSHPFGRPVNVFKFNPNTNQADINDEELDGIFLNSELKNRNAVIISLIGAFRKGKSFFLDNCLRYLYSNFKSISNPENSLEDRDNWMGGPNDPLIGFSWRCGAERDTTGVILWSDVFLHTDRATGEKLAIFIIDTQGLFDTQSTPAENSRIFALGTLISSMQVLNIFNLIQEDQLQYLQFATEFTSMVIRDKRDRTGKTFQNLLFLLRDWQHDNEFSFGFEGGEKYLETILKQHANQKVSLRTVREHIRSSFEDIKCCLLPHPGKIVARKSEYDGRWCDMDEEFRDELVKAIEQLLKPENLTSKKINNKFVTAYDMRGYVGTYFEKFQSADIPNTITLYEATIEREMNNLLDKLIRDYKTSIYESRAIWTLENLPMIHDYGKQRTLVEFKNNIIVGGKEHELKYEAMLVDQLDNLFEEWGKVETKTFTEKEEQQKLMEEAIAEKQQRYEEVKAAALEAQEAVEILERMNLESKLKNQEYEYDLKIEKMRLDAEQERLRNMETEKEKNEAFQRTLQLELENNRLRNQLSEKEVALKKKICTIA